MKLLRQPHVRVLVPPINSLRASARIFVFVCVVFVVQLVEWAAAAGAAAADCENARVYPTSEVLL